MRNEISGVIMAVVGFAGLSGPAQAQDAALGENLFRRCISCHEVGEDARNKSGPALTGVVGRIVASVEDYRYSRGLSAANDAGLIWNEDNLAAWLENPTGYLRPYVANAPKI